MNVFVFETNSVRTFTEFQADLIKEDTRNVLFSPAPTVWLPLSFNLQLLTIRQRFILTLIIQAQNDI